MTRDDVRAAAELVDSQSQAMKCDHIWNAHGSCQWCHKDKFDLFAGNVARAWLVEHPADDDGLITEEWLRAVGFADDEDHLCIVAPDRENEGLVIRRLSTGEWNAEDGFEAIQVPSPSTRGDVRLLCRALGVNLKRSK